ncbi:MAG: N4-gp56 family major capsid protein [Planctomycetota bacterium]
MDTTSTLSNQMAIYYNKRALDRLVPKLELFKFGQPDVIPLRMGKIIVWFRYLNLAAVTSAATEGVVGSANAMSSSRISDTLARYEDYVTHSDLLSMVAIDPIIESFTDIFANQIRLSIDTLCRNVLHSGTVRFANGKSAASDVATSDLLDVAELRYNVASLEGRDVQPHHLTEGFYPSIIHPNCKYDLTGDTATGGWIDIRKYTDSGEKMIEKNKAGDVVGARVFVSSNIYKPLEAASSAKLYYNLMFGEGAFGVPNLSNKGAGATFTKPNVIVKPVGSAGSADPTNKIGSVGWFIYFLAKLLDADRVQVIKTQASI